MCSSDPERSGTLSVKITWVVRIGGHYVGDVGSPEAGRSRSDESRILCNVA